MKCNKLQYLLESHLLLKCEASFNVKQVCFAIVGDNRNKDSTGGTRARAFHCQISSHWEINFESFRYVEV